MGVHFIPLFIQLVSQTDATFIDEEWERKFVIEGKLLDELCGKIRCLETKLEKYQSLNKELAIENNTLKEAQRVKIDYNREVHLRRRRR